MLESDKNERSLDMSIIGCLPEGDSLFSESSASGGGLVTLSRSVSEGGLLWRWTGTGTWVGLGIFGDEPPLGESELSSN